jgi:hypothetical protein
MAIPLDNAENAISKLTMVENLIPFNYNYLGKWCVFNCYCATQEETIFVRDLAKMYHGKISAYESQKLI